MKEITVYLKDKSIKMLLEILCKNNCISLPELFLKMPKSCVYSALRYLSVYEKINEIKLIEEKAGISLGKHLVKLIELKFPIRFEGKIAVVEIK